MNRRQFLQRGAMAAVAVSVAPAAVLAVVEPTINIRPGQIMSPPPAPFGVDDDGYWYMTWKDERGLNVVRCSIDKDGCSYIPQRLSHLVPKMNFHYVDGETSRQQMRDVGRTYLARYGAISA